MLHLWNVADGITWMDSRYSNAIMLTELYHINGMWLTELHLQNYITLK